MLAARLTYWFQGDEACVAYLDTGRAWVAAGAPIAAEHRLRNVSQDFCAAARAAGRRVVFFATEPRFVEATGWNALAIGEQPIWDPRQWESIVSCDRHLREQLRRSRAKQVTVRKLDPDELEGKDYALRLELEKLIQRWLDSKPLPPMGFLVRVEPFSHLGERRCYVAERGKELLGFANVVPVYLRQGWFIENLVRSPHAPNGTVELLVDRAMRDAANVGSSYVTLGLSPLAGATESWLAFARTVGNSFYDFAGLEAFKAKFRPTEWTPIYLSHPPTTNSYLAIYDCLVAFAGGRLVRYGLRAFVRGPELVLETLAVLLVPWTTALCFVDGRRWFPQAWMKWFWVVYDVFLCVALVRLVRRPQQWLADLLCGLVAFDALVTLMQATLVDVSRIRSVGEGLVLLVAVVAPALAGIVLFNVSSRMRRLG